jgi:hypothetical protein
MTYHHNLNGNFTVGLITFDDRRRTFRDRSTPSARKS